MADKGSVGIDANMMRTAGTLGQAGTPRVRFGGELHQIGASKDTTDGNPTQPSLKETFPHRRSFLWPVSSGSHTISVDVKFAADSGTGFRPKMIIRANAEVGIAADVSTEAAAGVNTWKTIGPVTVSPSSQGTLEVILAYDSVVGEVNIVHWDNVVVT